MLDSKFLSEYQAYVDQYVLPWGVNIATALVVFIIGRFIARLLGRLIEKGLSHSRLDQILVDFITSIVSTVLLLLVIVASLDQLGVNTTSLIALLGAAGLAVGLALKDSLQNFAAGVMLVVFRPFKDGDYVEIAGTAGIVEKISIFTTVLRSGDNKELIVPNGEIYHGVIVNYSKRPTRRVDMVFGIGYDDDLRKAKRILAEILEQDERVLKAPETVIAVSELADNSVNFIVRPWVNSADYWAVLWDTTEKVKLRFDEENISIPYPQMDVHLKRESDDRGAG